jgi:2-succinyl-6-hydroxy-2,4-cyclohexadiene-1-carboxylate synthase
VRLDATPTALAARRRGPTVEPPAGRTVFVHGFAQTAGCVGPLGQALADGHELLAVDAPGHDGSVRHARADLWRGAELLAATGGVANYVGYSMGGRLCLHAALAHPASVRRLVLIGATAGIEDARERDGRHDWDEQHARRLEEIGLDAFLAEWLAQPLFAGLPTWARFDAERRANTVAGLAASLRHAGTGSMDPLWDRLDGLDCPVLVLSGEHDARYGELGERLAAGIGPNARHLVVAGAGHAVHLEQPEATAEAILAFLQS